MKFFFQSPSLFFQHLWFCLRIIGADFPAELEEGLRGGVKQSTVSEREKPSVWLHRQQPAGRGGRQICTGSLNTSTAGVAKQSELNKYQSGRRNLVNGKLKTETLKVPPPPSSNSLTDMEEGLVP